MIDSHCHLHFDDLYNDIDKHLLEMQHNNVRYALTVATCVDDLAKVITLTKRYSNIFGSIGIHPNDILSNLLHLSDCQDQNIKSMLAKNTSDEELYNYLSIHHNSLYQDILNIKNSQISNVYNLLKRQLLYYLNLESNNIENISNLANLDKQHNLDNLNLDLLYNQKHDKNSKIIAIGETGLDYYRLSPIYSIEQKQIQQEIFNLHIKLANCYNLPLIIHTRASIDDTLTQLQQAKKKYDRIRGVMHCFSESIDYAMQFIELGFYISISGVVTFKNASNIKELAKQIPLERLLIETDAPFLAPHPFRGEINHPALVAFTAKCIAEIRQITIDELMIATSTNFCQLFDRKLFTD